MSRRMVPITIILLLVAALMMVLRDPDSTRSTAFALGSMMFAFLYYHRFRAGRFR